MRNRIFTLLVVAGFICCGSLLQAAPKSDNPNVKQVDVETFDKARQAPDVVVIDVRSPEEFAAGHIPKAVNVPVTGKNSEGFEKKIAEVSKDKKPLVYCKSGVRSNLACQKMTTLKIGPIVEMPGGWVAWSAAGKPSEMGKPAQ